MGDTAVGGVDRVVNDIDKVVVIVVLVLELHMFCFYYCDGDSANVGNGSKVELVLVFL